MKAPRELIDVVRSLGSLTDRVAFVGGMVRSLLVTDPGASPARPTDDVDLIVETPSLSDYQALAQELRERGFRECDEKGAPLCRWIVGEQLADVMPVDPGVFGFSNVWYAGAISRAHRVEEEGLAFGILDAPTFLATKIEAFHSRGGNDYLHHDVEDVLAVVDGREELLDEVTASPADVRAFIATTFAAWLADERFLELLPGHLEGDAAGQARLPLLSGRLARIAALHGTGEHAKTSASAKGEPVESSSLQDVAYDAPSQKLTITFHGGRRYAYTGVPAFVHAGLLAAWSKGRYFHQWIRDRYAYERLK